MRAFIIALGLWTTALPVLAQDWSAEPRCVGELPPEVEPISPDLIGPDNQYKLHGNVTHSASCVDAAGNRHVRYITVHDCFASWNRAPPGYCYHNESIGQPVTRSYIEYPAPTH